MDVRCDRCQTEYELEDDSVTEGGVAVQCTSCGHTFLVTRAQGRPGTPPAGQDPAGPPPAEWLLETADGAFHRFRDFTTLQKWIIERKVTRQDRISRTGQAWRALGDMVELASFFEVVDEADRARAAEAAVRALRTEADGRRAAPPAPPAGSAPRRPSLDSSLPDLEDSRPGARPSRHAPTLLEEERLSPLSGDRLEAVPLSPGARVMRTVAVLGFLGAAAIGVYVFAVRPGPLGLGNVVTPPAPPQASPPAPAPAPSPPPPPAASPEPQGPTAATESPAPTPGPPAPEPEAEVTPKEAIPPGPEAAKKEPPAAAAGGGAGGPAESYSKLVADADRLLENGRTDRALKLLDRALRMRPNGIEALTTMGYAMLDQDRGTAAVGMFRRALGTAPSYGPALFGLGEAYRHSGARELALQQYRRYLQIDPGGEDASAARRQIRELESEAPRSNEAPGSGSGQAASPAPGSPSTP